MGREKLKRIAISQSNYIPWKGYFRTIKSVDEFILYDEVQYTRRDWRNRNRIKTANGLKWLSVPVDVKGKFEQRIDETMVADSSWLRSHWSSIDQSYRDAPFFADNAPAFNEYFRTSTRRRLSDVNRDLIEVAMERFGLTTPLRWSTEFPSKTADRNDRLIEICMQAEAEEYLSGGAARAYLDEARFAAAGIAVTYIDYSGFDEYRQPHGTFEHGVTVLDLLFSIGNDPDLLGAT